MMRFWSSSWVVPDSDGSGLDVVWLPVNQAYLIMWMDQRIAGPLNGDDVEAWMAEHGFVRSL
jgi:hypothetical protein